MVDLVSDGNVAKIYINYAWNSGEELMKNAESYLRQAKIDAELNNFGTDNTDGL